MTYLPYSLSLMTSVEKSQSPESRMKVPISGRVKTSSIASMARRMSVAFFLLRAVGRREDQVDRRLGERDDVLRVAAPVGVGALDRDLALDDVAVEEGPELLRRGRADAQRDVVEVDEEGGVRGVHWRLAQVPCGPNQRSVHVSLGSGPHGPRATPSTHLAGPGLAAGQRGEREVGSPQGSLLGGHGEERSDRRLRAGSAGSPWRGSRNVPEVASLKNLCEVGGCW